MKKTEFEGIGFQDKWIITIGILLMGVIFPILNGMILNLTTYYVILNIIFSTFSTTAMWLGCRFIIFKVWKYFPWDKNPIKHIVYEILTIAIYLLIIVKFVFVMASLFLSKEMVKEYNFWEIYLSSAIISFIISFVHEAVFFYLLWINTSKRAEELEKESLLSQYETLKNQVNPHFLFNSFNTLISLIEEDKLAATEYVQKLSDFFRTILQHRDKSIITLKEEMELIHTYIFIQQKRYGNNLILNVLIPVESHQKGVAPLTLQMLVENAIKHNVISTEKPLNIEISLTENNFLLVKNNLQKRLEHEPYSGIGLQNIKNRYKYLTDKEIEVIISSNFYVVAIPLLQTV